MDSAFQELDYSDISAKHVTGSQNKKFSEIDTKRRGGILKLLISFILFVLLIVFIILAISKTITLNSLNDDIDKYNKEYTAKKNEMENRLDELNRIDEDIKKIELDIKKEDEEVKKIINDIKEIESINENLSLDIDDLSRQIEYEKSNLDKYEAYEESEFIEELQKLEDEIDLLRQTPME